MAGDPFVNYAPLGGAGLFGLVRDACQVAGFAPVVAQTVPQVGTIVCLVAAGLGVALVPESVCRLRLPEVLFRPLRDPPRTALLLVHRHDERSPAVQAVLRHGRAVARDKPG